MEIVKFITLTDSTRRACVRTNRGANAGGMQAESIALEASTRRRAPTDLETVAALKHSLS